MKTTDQQHVTPTQRSAGSVGPGQVEASAAAATGRDSGGGESGTQTSLTTAVMLVMILALLAVLTLLSAQSWQQRQAARAGEQALATARSYAGTVTTYDYRALSTNFAAALSGATGLFKSQYTDGSKLMGETLSRAHTVSKGTVIDAGIAARTAQQVTVVLFVDQSVTNNAHPLPQVIRSRMLMTLVPQDGRWLVSQLQLR
jgi:Mce-associated membrane protein